jgi:hypothetical protein
VITGSSWQTFRDDLEVAMLNRSWKRAAVGIADYVSNPINIPTSLPSLVFVSAWFHSSLPRKCTTSIISSNNSDSESLLFFLFVLCITGRALFRDVLSLMLLLAGFTSRHLVCGFLGHLNVLFAFQDQPSIYKLFLDHTPTLQS